VTVKHNDTRDYVVVENGVIPHTIRNGTTSSWTRHSTTFILMNYKGVNELVKFDTVKTTEYVKLIKQELEFFDRLGYNIYVLQTKSNKQTIEEWYGADDWKELDPDDIDHS
jgi:hypothetical protein